MDYKDTLNLPKTRFSMKAGLKEMEPAMQERWEKMGLYGMIRRKSAGKPRYTLHDGPPYPTGDLHIGTGMNKILKYIIVRYKTMRGFDVPFIPGWDCHGLPIEHKVMTSLGEKAKEMSAGEIRDRCLRFAMQYVESNRRQFKSLGCLGRWEKPYLTVDPRYEAAVIEVFRRLVEGGYVYRRLKPIHWCMHCKTALAEAELEYADREDESVYVAFRIAGGLREAFGREEDDAWLLIWTTTPWTLPANRAVAVHPDVEYVLADVSTQGAGDIKAVFARDVAERLRESAGVGRIDVLAECRGKDLVGLRYVHPISGEEGLPVVTADFVSVEEGTGCVHIAPGHGEEDYQVGVREGLDVLSPVDDGGNFTAEVAFLEGRNVFDANPVITGRLREEGKLLARSRIVHSYPHCWRCKKPVIFRATEQWFVSVDHEDLRKRCLEAVAGVRWIPSWGIKRIEGMLEMRPDWCISRQRYWGVPIPVFYCAECRTPLLADGVIAHVRDIFAREGSGAWFEKSPEELIPAGVACSECGCDRFVKETDIFDVWFESGSSHRAVVMEEEELDFPADLYLEGSDQHRGWFQLSLIPSVATTGKAPFKAVLTHGFVVDEQGQKMSKSLGNFISVDDALKEFGADVIRLWFSSVDYRNDVSVSRGLIKRMADGYRRIRNTFRFLLANLYDFDASRDAVPYEEMEEIDRWALAGLAGLVERVGAAYEDFSFHKVFHAVHDFCVVEMSSCYMDVQKDILYTLAPDHPARRSAQTAMHHILRVLVRILAPILVHTCEEVWQYLDEEEESVHLADWPEVPSLWHDEALLERWKRLLAVRDEVMRVTERLRQEDVIGSSLEASVTLYAAEEELRSFLDAHRELLPGLFIVSEVVLSDGPVEGAESARDVGGLFVKVARCEYPKCARCWNRRPDVGASEKFPEVCGRCVEQLETISVKEGGR